MTIARLDRHTCLVLAVVLVTGLSGCRTAAPVTPGSTEMGESITPAAEVAATLASLVIQEDGTASPSPVPMETSAPGRQASPPPVEAVRNIEESDSAASGSESTPGEVVTVTRHATVTPSPSAEPVTQMPSPTSVPPKEEPAEGASGATAGVVMDARVVYHNGFGEGLVGIYEPGAVPWLDLLVQLDGTWYGPEREPDDGIEARPLPEGYQWQASGSFGTLPNGEAWWNESGTAGVARLIGPDGAVILELPIQIVFRSGGGGGSDSGPDPTPT